MRVIAVASPASLILKLELDRDVFIESFWWRLPDFSDAANRFLHAPVKFRLAGSLHQRYIGNSTVFFNRNFYLAVKFAGEGLFPGIVHLLADDGVVAGKAAVASPSAPGSSSSPGGADGDAGSSSGFVDGSLKACGDVAGADGA